MSAVKITHPVEGYNGHVRVGDRGLHFLAGVSHADELPGEVRESLEAAGFTVEDDEQGESPGDE